MRALLYAAGGASPRRGCCATIGSDAIHDASVWCHAVKQQTAQCLASERKHDETPAISGNAFALVAGSAATMAQPHRGAPGHGYARQHVQPSYDYGRYNYRRPSHNNNAAGIALGALALGAIVGLAAQNRSPSFNYGPRYYGSSGYGDRSYGNTYSYGVGQGYGSYGGGYGGPYGGDPYGY